MRSKSPLALMEQVVMVLVFALAAALCLQVFVLSDQMSEKNRDTDRAVLLAQNTAETIKACGGVEGLGQAAIEVFRWDGNEGLFALTVAWQEVNGNG